MDWHEQEDTHIDGGGTFGGIGYSWTFSPSAFLDDSDSWLIRSKHRSCRLFYLPGLSGT